MKKLVFLFVSMLFLQSNSAQAAQGCVVNNDDNIYTFDTGTNHTEIFFIFTLGPYKVYTTPLSTQAPNCPRAQLGTNTGTLCWRGPNPNIFDLGTIYNYTYLTAPIGCPIDDYIPFLILATGGLGFLYIRKRTNVLPL